MNCVLGFTAAKNFGSTVSDDLVHVHVGRGAGTTLNRVDNESILHITGDYFIAGSLDRSGLFRRKVTCM